MSLNQRVAYLQQHICNLYAEWLQDPLQFYNDNPAIPAAATGVDKVGLSEDRQEINSIVSRALDGISSYVLGLHPDLSWSIRETLEGPYVVITPCRSTQYHS